ncbi:hypothetical protein K491DRAFT_603119, partial [Lophiostoma macrostomum CBS 122681]
VEDYPNGYPRLAALLNSNTNWLICRKYEFLHTRVLLYQQDKLRVLEKKLLTFDEAAKKSDDIALKFHEDGARPMDKMEEQSLLIKTINEELKEYHDIVQRTRSFASLQCATKRNHRSVWNWIYSSAPLVQDDASTFRKNKDFVAIVDPKEGLWLNSHFDSFLSKHSQSKFGAMFMSNHERNLTSNELVRIYSPRRIDVFSRLLITAAIVSLLLAPVAVLYSIRKHGWLRILIIFVFTLVFSVAMNLGTKAKRHEVLAATATYCAVLVVFLGNV